MNGFGIGDAGTERKMKKKNSSKGTGIKEQVSGASGRLYE